jgi:hypothetical protein
MTMASLVDEDPNASSPSLSKGSKPAQKQVDLDEHMLSFTELMSRLETSFDDKKPAESTGITEDEQKKRLAVHGLNQLAPPVKGLFYFTNFYSTSARGISQKRR